MISLFIIKEKTAVVLYKNLSVIPHQRCILKQTRANKINQVACTIALATKKPRIVKLGAILNKKDSKFAPITTKKPKRR